MVRRHATAFRLALVSADFAAAVALFAAVSMLRYGSEWLETWRRLGVDPSVAAVGYAVGWIVLVWLHGLYRPRARLAMRSDAIALARATVVLAVATLAVLFLIRIPDASRQLLFVLFGLQAVTAIASRALLRTLFASLRARGNNARFVLVAGANADAQDFADRLERHTELGLRVIGHLAGPDGVHPALSRPVLGTLDDIEEVLHGQVVDEVAVCLPIESWRYVEAVTRLCEDEGKIVRIPTTDGGPRIAGGLAEDFDGLTVLSLVYGPDRAISLSVKRIGDAVLAALGIVVLSPLFIAVALLIRQVDGGPVLFRQTRVGLHGRRFELLKFRTMVPEAEELLSEIAPLNEIRGNAFKVTDDPRLTRSGRLLRRTSLDELPQLWNVLRGDMSLVGPRPPLPSEVDGYDVWHRRRLSMKPGITGLWQVSARRDPDFDRWVQMDLEYIDRWSLLLDLKILLRTVPAVVGQEGR